MARMPKVLVIFCLQVGQVTWSSKVGFPVLNRPSLSLCTNEQSDRRRQRVPSLDMIPAERSTKAPQRKSKAGRKAPSSKPSSTVKSTAKSPRERLAADSLQWKAVKNTASFAGIDEGGGMMMLEELDDVGVEWTEENGAKIAKFVVSRCIRCCPKS